MRRIGRARPGATDGDYEFPNEFVNLVRQMVNRPSGLGPS